MKPGLGNLLIRYMYIAPALLLMLSVFCGLLPAWTCAVDDSIYRTTAIGIFVISLVFHFAILGAWQYYLDYAPLAYAIIQPSLHLFILAFTFAVSFTNPCKPETLKINYEHKKLFDIVDDPTENTILKTAADAKQQKNPISPTHPKDIAK